MPKRLRLPILTMFVPAYCANCRHPYSELNFKFTLVGTEERCAWLCNECFVRLHADAMEKENIPYVKIALKPTPEIVAVENCVERESRNEQRNGARMVGRLVKDGKNLMEHIDSGEEE
jgi:hypothetical protein